MPKKMKDLLHLREKRKKMRVILLKSRDNNSMRMLT